MLNQQLNPLLDGFIQFSFIQYIVQVMDQRQQLNKPIFTSPPDESTQNVNNILFSIEQQENKIKNLLSKYKQYIPDDNLELQNERKNIDQIKILNKVKNRKKDISLKNTNIDSKQTPKNSIKNKSINQSKTLQINRFDDSSNKKVQKYNKKVMLPKLNRSKTNQESKGKSTKINQSASNNYYGKNTQNQKYSFKNDEESQSVKIRKDINQDKLLFSQKKRTKQISQQVWNYSQKSIRQIRKDKIEKKAKQKKLQENIQEQGQLSILDKQQIQKPLSYNLYERISKNQSTNKVEEELSKIQKDSDDQKSSQVSLTLYMRLLNQKINQQCQQQINYLYFSKAEQNSTNKQWAQQIILMFQKHDKQLQVFHKSMSYLQRFDQGFFSSGIYSTNKQFTNKL